MATIGIAGFLHETNTFESAITPLAAFIEADAWPGMLVGQQVIDATRQMNLAVSGFVQAAEQAGHRLAPLLWCSANPSGPVAQTAFDTILTDLENRLAAWPQLDALFLDLHGAMVTEHMQDAEGVLLARLRQLRPGLPIVAALDFHANISAAMLDNSDALVAYRSYPHVDMASTGRRAANLLGRILEGEVVHQAARRLPFIIPMPWQSTLAEPGARLMDLACALQHDGVREAQFIPGFPLADIHDCGPTILVYADTVAAAEHAANVLCEQAMQAKPAFSGQLYSIETAVTRVLAWQASFAPDAQAHGTMVLADTQDNPGGGAAADTTDLLRALLNRGVRAACAGVVCDPAFAASAHATGVGNLLTQPLGGRSGVGGPPLDAAFRVMALGDGHFTGTGPFYLGCRMALGPMARVRVGELDIVVSSRKQQAADQAMLRHVGAEPAHYQVLALKSSVHFRADFAGLASEILVVAAPGVNTADLHALHFVHLRQGMEVL